jgi:hypothetical protein
MMPGATVRHRAIRQCWQNESFGISPEGECDPTKLKRIALLDMIGHSLIMHDISPERRIVCRADGCACFAILHACLPSASMRLGSVPLFRVVFWILRRQRLRDGSTRETFTSPRAEARRKRAKSCVRPLT